MWWVSLLNMNFRSWGPILEFYLHFMDYLGVIGADMGSRPVFGSKR